ncbi:MAG: hypothetical protein ACLPVY_13875 [Acidimicrobiia bacterium]
MPDRLSDDGQWYEGTSDFLLWAPKVFVFMALAMYVIHGSHWIEFSTTFLVLACIHSRWLPWRFEIRDDGIQLRFPFGRYLFLSRSVATVRVDVVGAMVYDDRRRRLRFGYPLMDGILYQPGRESLLRSAFVRRGYTVT